MALVKVLGDVLTVTDTGQASLHPVPHLVLSVPESVLTITLSWNNNDNNSIEIMMMVEEE